MLDVLDRDQFVRDNMGLVHACCNRFRGRGIEYEDMFSAGCVGLVKALDGFDQSRGLQFSTYAVPVILGEIRRLFRDGGAVKVSRSLKETSLKVGREREKFLKQYGREPTVSEIAQRLGLDAETVSEAVSASMPVLSLTESDDEGGGQLDVPVDAPDERITEMMSLREAIGQLEPKDRQLILLRYFGEKTQVETAALLEMTQVQVSRREKKLLQFLRKQLE